MEGLCLPVTSDSIRRLMVFSFFLELTIVNFRLPVSPGCPLAATELFCNSAPFLNHLMVGAGTEPILQVKLTFEPEISGEA